MFQHSTQVAVAYSTPENIGDLASADGEQRLLVVDTGNAGRSIPVEPTLARLITTYLGWTPGAPASSARGSFR
ncbi:hypothetical protein [Kineococcus sp. SYSU DK018]|uniref:hypothetical protein n=1 Tax=Kineococcus sp. SYSU DK018 TaxID=3383139 RepID=UPI003D7DFA04